jgi:regulator of replication initiation timing
MDALDSRPVASPPPFPELRLTSSEMLAEVGLLSMQRQRLLAEVQRLQLENAQLRARVQDAVAPTEATP